MGRLPLEGVRVVEVGHIVAGPTAGLLLADLGAEVVKVEPPDAGTPRRPGNLRTGPFYFFNRNKRSVVLDLAAPEGHAVALRLARWADVLVENMAPGALDRLGLGYEELRRQNPRLVYASVKGFLSGPYQGRPLLDELAQMMSGLAYMTGPPGRPLRAGASVVDIGAATFAVLGVLAALLQRQTTGEGQRVAGGLFETALFYVGQHLAHTQFSGEEPTPFPSPTPHAKKRGWAVYDLFPCRDGRQLFIGAVSDAQWRRLCAALGLEGLADDPRLQNDRARAQEREWLIPRLAEAVAGWESDALLQRLVEAGVSVAPVHTPRTVLEDPHVVAPRRTLPARLGAAQGRLPPLPYESSAYEFAVRRHAPHEPGAHTREVLLELGLAPAEVEALARRGVVRGPDLPAPGREGEAAQP